jgi:hypothetical protein
MCLPCEQHRRTDLTPPGRVLESQKMPPEADVGFQDQAWQGIAMAGMCEGNAVRGAAGDLDTERSLPGGLLTSKHTLAGVEPDPATPYAAYTRARRRAHTERADRQEEES